VLQGGFVPSQNRLFSGVLQAQSAITGAFSSVGNFTPTMVAELEYTPYSVDLVAVCDYTNSELTLTPNQRQVGNMLADAFQQISPDMAASPANLGFAASNLFREDLTQRIANLRHGTAGGEAAEIGRSDHAAYTVDAGLRFRF
jgi:uncharacterized protein with beta-barrel porin domain